MKTTSRGHIAMDRVGPIFIASYSNEGWGDDEYRDYCEIIVEMVAKEGPLKGIWNFSPKSSPSARQRKMMSEYGERLQTKSIEKSVLVSDSTMVRGGLTAMGWVMGFLGKMEMQAYKSTDWRNGVEWLCKSYQTDPLAVESRCYEVTAKTGFTLR